MKTSIFVEKQRVPKSVFKHGFWHNGFLYEKPKKTICFVYFSIVKAKCCHSLLVEFGMFVIAPFVWRSEMVFISGAIYRAIVDKGDIYGAILRYWGAAKSKINFLGEYLGARMTD